MKNKDQNDHVSASEYMKKNETEIKAKIINEAEEICNSKCKIVNIV